MYLSFLYVYFGRGLSYYNFNLILQVQAFTKIGLGVKSSPTSVNTAIEHPIPTLLIASQESIYVYDIDLNQTTPLVVGITDPKQITYLLKEKKIIWVDKKGEIFLLNLFDNAQSKIFDINGQADGIAIDWLGRCLYYTQKLKDQSKSAVFKLDLSLDKLESKKVLESTEGPITKLEVSPFTRSLYWIETSSTLKHILMQSDISGEDKRQFFSDHKNGNKLYNCPYRPEIGPFFAIDHSDVGVRPKIIFWDIYSQSIMWADKYSESCGLLADSNEVRNDFPLEHLEADFSALYWTHNGILHDLSRNDKLISKEVCIFLVILYRVVKM